MAIVPDISFLFHSFPCFLASSFWLLPITLPFVWIILITIFISVLGATSGFAKLGGQLCYIRKPSRWSRMDPMGTGNYFVPLQEKRQRWSAGDWSLLLFLITLYTTSMYLISSYLDLFFFFFLASFLFGAPREVSRGSMSGRSFFLLDSFCLSSLVLPLAFQKGRSGLTGRLEYRLDGQGGNPAAWWMSL